MGELRASESPIPKSAPIVAAGGVAPPKPRDAMMDPVVSTEDLEAQVSRLGGEVVYLWKPEHRIEPVVFCNTSLYRQESSDTALIAQRRLQNRNEKLTVDWRDNPSTTVLSYFDLRRRVIEPVVEVSLLHDFGLSFEDVRIVDHSDSGVVLIGAVWPVALPKSGPNRAVTHQAIVRLDEAFRVASLEVPPLGDNGDPRRYEKNWMPWLGTTRVTYSLDGVHTTYDIESLSPCHARGIRWAYGQPHGGTQWLRVGETSVGVFHSSSVVETGSTVEERYVLGAARVSNEAPYDVLEMTPVPFLSASSSNPSIVGSTEVLFASGIALFEGSILLGIGINDAASAIVVLPAASFFGLLKETSVI